MTRPLLIVALACALAAPAGANAAEVKLRALLSGGNVVSATPSRATGEVRALLDDDNDLRIDLVYAGLEARAIGAAVHVGKPNENGLLVQRLELDSDEDSGRVVGAEIDVSDEVATRIRAGEAYVVVATIEYPDGAIRGQLQQQPVQLPEPLPPEG